MGKGTDNGEIVDKYLKPCNNYKNKAMA